MRRLGPRRRALVAAPLLLVLALLSGCQSSATDDLEQELAGLPGVQAVDVDATRVKATLDDDLPAADAQSAILAVRDAAVAGHSLGDAVELVVVLNLGDRDNGGSAPWKAYAYGRWAGTATAGAFDQQATFLASLADWEAVLTTPARILRVGLDVEAVPADPATEAPADGETPAAEPTSEPAQVVALHLGQPVGAGNAEADVAALRTELAGLWAASGGAADGIAID